MKPGGEKGYQHPRQRVQRVHGGEKSAEGGSPTGVARRDGQCGAAHSRESGRVVIWGDRSQIVGHFKYRNKDFRLYPANTWSLRREVTWLLETCTCLSGADVGWMTDGLAVLCSSVGGVSGHSGEETRWMVV